jgi:hypothetical protein
MQYSSVAERNIKDSIGNDIGTETTIVIDGNDHGTKLTIKIDRGQKAKLILTGSEEWEQEQTGQDLVQSRIQHFAQPQAEDISNLFEFPRASSEPTDIELLQQKVADLKYQADTLQTENNSLKWDIKEVVSRQAGREELFMQIYNEAPFNWLFGVSIFSVAIWNSIVGG